MCHGALKNILLYIPPPTTTMNYWMNLIKQTTIFSINVSLCLTFMLYVTPSIKVIQCHHIQCHFKNFKNTLWKRLIFSWLHFDDRWNVFVKICTVSIRRVCSSRWGRKFLQRNCWIFVGWIKIVYTFLCSSHSRSHI